MALPLDTYFRVRITRADNGESFFHNQPFATREAAEFGARQLRSDVERARRSDLIASIEVVQINAR
jgi:hypothetical protein